MLIVDGESHVLISVGYDLLVKLLSFLIFDSSVSLTVRHIQAIFGRFPPRFLLVLSLCPLEDLQGLLLDALLARLGLPLMLSVDTVYCAHHLCEVVDFLSWLQADALPEEDYGRGWWCCLLLVGRYLRGGRFHTEGLRYDRQLISRLREVHSLVSHGAAEALTVL